MTGVCSPSMPVWVVEDEASGARAFSTLNEGPGRTLWFGVGDDEAVERLRFFRDDARAAAGARCSSARGPIDVFDLAAQGLQMGDELHMRSQATGNLLLARPRCRRSRPRAARTSARVHRRQPPLLPQPRRWRRRSARRWRPRACRGLDASCSLMSRNGTDMGLQLAGLPGRWFTAPAAPVQDALLREGFAPDDAALDIGDSAVIECIGLGGMALAAAPAVAAFFGGDAADAAARTRADGRDLRRRARRASRSPALDYAGTPGRDRRAARRRARRRRRRSPPACCTRRRAPGQIGAGVAHQPLEPFRDALAALVDELDGVSVAGDRRARAGAPARGLARRCSRPRRGSTRDGFVVLVTPPGTPWLPNAIALGPGPTVVWDPVVARIEPGPALAARGERDPARAGRRATRRASPARSPARRDAPAAGRGRGARSPRWHRRRRGAAPRGARAARPRPGLTPEGDDLLAGACRRRRRGGRPAGAARPACAR